jgi:hypothetical protein
MQFQGQLQAHLFYYQTPINCVQVMKESSMALLMEIMNSV